jgi:hypothetical protein
MVESRVLIAVVMLDYANLETNNEPQENNLEKLLFHTVFLSETGTVQNVGFFNGSECSSAKRRNRKPIQDTRFHLDARDETG